MALLTSLIFQGTLLPRKVTNFNSLAAILTLMSDMNFQADVVVKIMSVFTTVTSPPVTTTQPTQQTIHLTNQSSNWATANTDIVKHKNASSPIFNSTNASFPSAPGRDGCSGGRFDPDIRSHLHSLFDEVSREGMVEKRKP